MASGGENQMHSILFLQQTVEHHCTRGRQHVHIPVKFVCACWTILIVLRWRVYKSREISSHMPLPPFPFCDFFPVHFTVQKQKLFRNLFGFSSDQWPTKVDSTAEDHRFVAHPFVSV